MECLSLSIAKMSFTFYLITELSEAVIEIWLRLKRGFGGCRHGFGGYDRFGGFSKFDGLGF